MKLQLATDNHDVLLHNFVSDPLLFVGEGRQ